MATTTTSETSKKLSRLFAVMIVVGLIMALFGYFGPFEKSAGTSFDSGSSISSLDKDNKSMKAEGSPMKGFAPLKFFVRATFILGIVTIVWFVLLCVLYIDNPELIYLVIGGLTVLASILSFIFVLIVLSSYKSYQTLAGIEDVSVYGLSYGGFCLSIGGLLFGGGTAGMALTTPKVEVLHKG